MRNLCVSLGLVVVGLVVLAPKPAQAIPPFAREYGVPCSTCHITVTRRNEFGDAFRRAGYRWPTKLESDQDGRPMPPVEMRGASMMDGLLPARPPIGLIAYFAASYTNDDTQAHQATFTNPLFNIVFGSNLGKHAAIFGTVASNGTPNELVAHFARLANRPELNLRVGLIEQSTTLFKTNEGLLGGYLIGSANPTGHAMQTARAGTELNGIVGRRFFYALGAVENNGPGTPLDGYYHVGTKVGGMTYRGDEPDIDFDRPSFWDQSSLQLAHWGYVGKVEDGGKELAKIRRFGFDMQLNLPFGSLWSGMMAGFDRDLTQVGPGLPLNGIRNKSLTWFGEASYRATSWLTAAYIYQFHDASSLVAGKEIQSHEVGLIALAMDNLRIRLKFKYTPDDMKNESLDLQALIGF
jgi:hypothetical protein